MNCKYLPYKLQSVNCYLTIFVLSILQYKYNIIIQLHKNGGSLLSKCPIDLLSYTDLKYDNMDIALWLVHIFKKSYKLDNSYSHIKMIKWLLNHLDKSNQKRFRECLIKVGFNIQIFKWTN